ncbi:MAG: zeta toxin family protein [Elusimicrobiota bacterium]
MLPELDQRPIIVAIAGPNGAGKTTFHDIHLKYAGLRYIEADALAEQLGIDAYEAAKMADALRRELMAQRESFAFETVFSDPVGDKRKFLKEAVGIGYTVLLCFIGLASADLSEERVSMRVSRGGHDVPTEKLKSRFPRTMANLKASIRELPIVCIFDNSDPGSPFRKVAVFKDGRRMSDHAIAPAWLEPLMG